MPVIPEMDEFVNWDNADPAVGLGVIDPQLIDSAASRDLDLALENVDGDDFSFWALQHYDSCNLPTLDLIDGNVLGASGTQTPAFELSFETPEAPCAHCKTGGYQCKRINEGKYKGYCTSCVALRCECSFGFASSKAPAGSAVFPSNPWPTLGDHPGAIPQEDIQLDSSIAKRPSNAGLPISSSPSRVGDVSPTAPAMSKIGARFSRESVKILKNWLSTHNRHPYPTEEEKEMLQKQTGLNKTQITNWLANARRRGKIVAPRSTSPGIRSWTNAIDIPQKRGTNSTENMNPLQRWQNSPPENEPASVTAIARAVTASTSTLSSGFNSPFSANFTDDGSSRSLCAGSSASSRNTSNSSRGSFASAYSHASHGSVGSFGSGHRGRRRRRRRAAPKNPDEKTPLSTPLKTFQCTFCTETFRTKHDWQRHEKSLHLSLERWVCAPNGPRAPNPENNKISCVFCGEANPDDAHVETHNHSACQERTLEERTFYRKDHLRQHLKLVHDVKFVPWSMEPWKVATPQIRSRCGFCGIVMDTWTIRVDHLAEHFKAGYSMADWKGDWGFEPPVLDMVESSIPPYLIHDERNSPYPYHATRGSPASPRNAFELLKSELWFYLMNVQDSNEKRPSDEELQVEACRIIFGSEVLSKKGVSSTPSWLRDVIMSNQQLAVKAQLAPIRSKNDSRMARLQINGRDNIFEDDDLEKELQEFVKARRLLGLTAMDGELQVEACNIIGRIEELSMEPCDEIANFLVRLILGSSKWLASFRQRAQLPRSEDVADELYRSKDPTIIDSTIHNYSRLETELAEYVETQRLLDVEPDDADLQRQARVIIYEYDDPWNQTAADNVDWLNAFKQRHLSISGSSSSGTTGQSPLTLESVTKPGVFTPSAAPTAASSSSIKGRAAFLSSPNNSLTARSGPVKVSPFFLNDANCYRRLARELKRYVHATMSPNNPNCHVPSDEELQHQARWILYDDDDPWNQTAADNAEWLRRFKRDSGILTDTSLPGLPEGSQWSISQGGTGFAPPYALPKSANTRVAVPASALDAESVVAVSMSATAAPASLGGGSSSRVAIPSNEGSRAFETDSSTANKYLASLVCGRIPPPARVFCARELEDGLAQFVTAEVVGNNQSIDTTGAVELPLLFPSDDAMRAKAREIIGTPNTAADDPVLLEKFKTMMTERLALGTATATAMAIPATVAVDTASAAPLVSAPVVDAQLPFDMDIIMTDGQLTDILQDVNFDFGEGTDFSNPSLGGGLLPL